MTQKLHAYMPCLHRVPPNVKFEVDDCEEPWTFTEKFDVVHARYLAAAIQDWPKLVSQAFQFTKPGGYAEFQDYDLQYYSEDGTTNDDCTSTRVFPSSMAFCGGLTSYIQYPS